MADRTISFSTKQEKGWDAARTAFNDGLPKDAQGNPIGALNTNQYIRQRIDDLGNGYYKRYFGDTFEKDVISALKVAFDADDNTKLDSVATTLGVLRPSSRALEPPPLPPVEKVIEPPLPVAEPVVAAATVPELSPVREPLARVEEVAQDAQATEVPKSRWWKRWFTGA